MFRRKKNQFPSITLVQGSLHPSSHTAILLDAAGRILSARGIPHSALDLREADLDLYTGGTIERYSKKTQAFIDALRNADVILFGVPAYSSQTPGPLKNAVDLARDFLKGKKVGLICFSEKGTAYSASLDFLQQLVSCGVSTLQPVVIASLDSFRGSAIFDDVVLQLLDELIDAALQG